VIEGVVTTTAGTENKDINAGESAAVCTNCSESALAMCSTPETDAQAAPEDDVGVPAGDAAGEGGTVVVPDAGAADAPSADAGPAADAAPGPDAPPVVLQDAATPADAMPTPDAPVRPDAAAPMPDAAPPKPDAAQPMPDAAAPTPDAAQPSPDAAQPSLDMAYDTQSIPVDARQAVFAITPFTKDFGSLTIGQTSGAVNFTVTNQGDLPSDTPTVKIVGEFAVSTNGCINPVPANTSCVIGVVFKPLVAGVRMGNLIVTTSGGDAGSAALMGTGVSPLPAQFSLKPMTHDFGWKQMNRATGDVIFTLTNTGGQDSGIPTVRIGGKDAAEFGINAGRIGPCPTALPKMGGSCTIAVHFNPTSAGNNVSPKNATLDVVGSPGGTASATLTGNATLATGGLEIDPPFRDLGSVPAGMVMSSPMTFTVRNIGTVALNNLMFPIATAHAANNPPREFTFSSTDCSGQLVLQPPGSPTGPTSCTLSVTYQQLNGSPPQVPPSPKGLRQLEFTVTATNAQTGAQAAAAAHVQATAQ
jgi:hypothetical protein